MNKIVYVLVSNGDDHYLEMAMLSIFSLRKLSPNIRTEVVIDELTESLLIGARSELYRKVDYVNVQRVPYEGPMQISRSLKTNLRTIVDGDFLYIDIDAIPVKAIDHVFDTVENMALCLDGNVSKPSDFVFYDFELKTFEKMNWPIPTSEYFNCGVMFVKDVAVNYVFFDKWHSLWKQASSQGLHKDQPPFHEALRVMNLNCKILPPQYNALISMYTGGVRGAHIMHYSTIRFTERNDTHFHTLVKKLKITGEIDLNLFSKILDSGYPWSELSPKKVLLTKNYRYLLSSIFYWIMRKLTIKNR